MFIDSDEIDQLDEQDDNLGDACLFIDVLYNREIGFGGNRLLPLPNTLTFPP